MHKVEVVDLPLLFCGFFSLSSALVDDPFQVDIGLTAYGNAQEYYAEAKRRANKHAKTVAASQMAIKVGISLFNLSSQHILTFSN